jgi:hypothetical protein
MPGQLAFLDTLTYRAHVVIITDASFRAQGIIARKRRGISNPQTNLDQLFFVYPSLNRNFPCAISEWIG